MTRRKIIATIFIFLLLSLGCSSLIFDSNTAPSSVIETPVNSNIPLIEADVPRVTADDAKAAYDQGNAIIVDVRSRAAYEASHVDGVLSIPLNEFETNIVSVDLPKDQWIITCCT